MAALDRLADVYETFEDTWALVERETAEVDTLFAEVYVAMDDLATAQQYQARLQDELKHSCESHDIALTDLKECMSMVEDTREPADDRTEEKGR